MEKEGTQETIHHTILTERAVFSHIPFQIAFRGDRWVERRELKPPTDRKKLNIYQTTAHALLGKKKTRTLIWF